MSPTNQCHLVGRSGRLEFRILQTLEDELIDLVADTFLVTELPPFRNRWCTQWDKGPMGGGRFLRCFWLPYQVGFGTDRAGGASEGEQSN